ncbi:hypothetical protein, partial [Bradyrhizobium sp. SZCCHNS1054]|uniref:hypothetical protein n=1 Tax=Bradyrhizobium sp. SZCCHNS1054 TaxID=3057301 RepID=UPI00291645B6
FASLLENASINRCSRYLNAYAAFPALSSLSKGRPDTHNPGVIAPRDGVSASAHFSWRRSIERRVTKAFKR